MSLNTIGGCEIVSQIGAGGMATVYKAYQPRLDRHVAVKVMHKNFSEDRNFRARFEREARIVAKLDHPNIVPIYDYDDRDGEAYLVMKYIDGVTLKTLLRQESLSPREIVDFMTPIAAALTYAHRQGILHRDIKPSNILIDKQSTPYLTDFGLARIAQQGESTMSVDTMLGTPHYISPEQAKGETDLTSRADVYSLGVVLYELVVGRVPFVSDTSYALIHDHIYTPPPPPSELNPAISPEVENVLLKALAKAPQDRYETPVAMLAAYRQAAGLRDAAPATETTAPVDDVHDLSVVDEDVPQGFMARFVRGIETFGEHMEAGFRDFDKDEYGNPLTESEVKARAKAEAKDIFKESVEQALRASGFRQGAPGAPGRWDKRQMRSQIRRMRKQGGGAEVRIGFGGKHRDDDDYGNPMSEEDRLRMRVEKRIEKQSEEFVGLVIHLVIFILINSWLFGLGDWARAMWQGAFGWPHIVTMLWGIGMFAHLADYYNKYGPGYRRRERIIQQEMERERRRLYGDESVYKAKNEEAWDENRRVRLTEDGELTNSFVDEQQRKDKRR